MHDFEVLHERCNASTESGPTYIKRSLQNQTTVLVLMAGNLCKCLACVKIPKIRSMAIILNEGLYDANFGVLSVVTNAVL